MEGFADEVRREVNGNVTGILNPDSSFKILLAGHIDEIGLMVTDHTEEGFLRAARVGGLPRGCIWDRRCGLTRERTWYTGAVASSGELQKKEELSDTDLVIDIGAGKPGSGQKACACGVRCGVWIRIGGPCWGNASPPGLWMIDPAHSLSWKP